MKVTERLRLFANKSSGKSPVLCLMISRLFSCHVHTQGPMIFVGKEVIVSELILRINLEKIEDIGGNNCKGRGILAFCGRKYTVNTGFNRKHELYRFRWDNQRP